MKKWNAMGKMAVCSFAAAMMVMIGSEFGLTARAEMVIDGDKELQAVQEEVLQADQEVVPESDDKDVLEADAPAAEELSGAGELGIEMMEIVEIQENMVPGAACPEINLFEGEAEAEQEQQAEMPEEAKAAAAEDSETCVSGTLTYEDDEVTVTVVASEAAQLPANTEVKVTKLVEGSEKYEAAKEAAQSLAADENASYTFYDVTLESEGQALDVAEGTVSVWMEFKTADAEDKDVVSIEETESGKVARNVTDTTAANERAGSVAIDY